MIRDFGPARVAFVYALFGTLWILLSDALAVRLIADGSSLPLVQTLKGLFYVGITAGLVYGLARYSTRRIREERTRYSEMAENMHDIFYNYDPVHERLLFAGRGYERIWGLPMEHIHADPMSFLDSIHPDDREAVMAAHGRDLAGDSTETEFRVIRPDGSMSWVLDRSFSIFGAEGVVERIVGTMRDITELKRAEAERQQIEERYRQIQKLEAIGQLAGGVAHDFNNMLTVILVRAEMALRDMAPDDPARAGLREIHDAAERSAGLTRQLLTYARRQPVMARALVLNPLVEAALPMLRRLIGTGSGAGGGGIRLAWIPGRAPWAVEIDPSQVDQILVNLCLNARDAMPDGGEILIKTRNVVLGADDCRARPELAPGDHVILTVSDTGVGMDKETIARLFEPFFTTKEVGRGTGLGLPTVHGIVRQSHGAIEVDSEPGAGSAFRIYLPRYAEGPADRAAVTAETPSESLNALPRGGGETVLIVEGDPAVRRLAAELLGGLGYAAFTVGSGEEALRFAREHAGDIHLLMTDAGMPGTGGTGFAERFRELRPRARRLFMSADTARPAEARDAAESWQFVRKPFATAELAIKVRAALASSP